MRATRSTSFSASSVPFVSMKEEIVGRARPGSLRPERRRSARRPSRRRRSPTTGPMSRHAATGPNLASGMRPQESPRPTEDRQHSSTRQRTKHGSGLNSCALTTRRTNSRDVVDQRIDRGDDDQRQEGGGRQAADDDQHRSAPRSRRAPRRGRTTAGRRNGATIGTMPRTVVIAVIRIGRSGAARPEHDCLVPLVAPELTQKIDVIDQARSRC